MNSTHSEQPVNSISIWSQISLSKKFCPICGLFYFFPRRISFRYNEMKSLQAAVKVGKINDMMNYAEILLDKRLRKCSNFIWYFPFVT